MGESFLSRKYALITYDRFFRNEFRLKMTFLG
jgi:hypothetical protein